MYIDILHYQIVAGLEQQDFLAITQQVHQQWMRHLDGFVRWDIHANSEGHYTDIVVWENEAAAKNAEKQMNSMPLLQKWEQCYDQESIRFSHLKTLKVYTKS